MHEFVTWGATTQDLIAFQTALRYVAAEQWPIISSRLTEALAGGTGEGGRRDAGLAAQQHGWGGAARTMGRDDDRGGRLVGVGVRGAGACRCPRDAGMGPNRSLSLPRPSKDPGCSESPACAPL